MTDPAATQVAALPWRRDSRGCLEFLLVTSRTSKRWILPKGWPMPGKPEWEAALIEASEEAGVEGTIGTLALGSFSYVKDRGRKGARAARARVYPLEVTTQRDVWEEMHMRERLWVAAADAAAIVSEPELSDFLADLIAQGRIGHDESGARPD